MRISKLIIMSCLTVITLGCSVSYAQENGSPIFLMGKVGNSVGFDNCSGPCSAASPSGMIGVGFSGEFFTDENFPIKARNSISLEYKRDRFNFNGNVLNVQEKAINLALEFVWKKYPQFILGGSVGIGQMTSGGPNVSDRTASSYPGGIDFLYKVSPTLYLSVGYTHTFILSGYPDFIANGMDVGLRWYP